MKALSDQALLQQIAEGSREAFSELYDRHAGQLWGIAVKILKDRQQAADALQDVFLRIWKNAASFQFGRGAPLLWMCYICRNRCIDLLRARAAHPGKHGLDNEEVEYLKDLEADPAGEADNALLRQKVRRAMATLPPAQQVIIDLAYCQGFSQSQIAERLELPVGTVKSRMRLAMEKLRKLLASAGSPEK